MKFRGSYSVLNAWESGNWEQAIKMYFKLGTFTTEAMSIGRKYHEEWEKHIVKNKTLPEVFGSKTLINPKTEHKIVAQLDDWLEFVGVVDVLDTPTIYEFKTGKSSSEEYASSKQMGVYAVIALLSGEKIENIDIYRFDPFTKQSDFSRVWVDEDMLKKSVEWISTLSSEMHSYLTQNQLYEKFGNK